MKYLLMCILFFCVRASSLQEQIEEILSKEDYNYGFYFADEKGKKIFSFREKEEFILASNTKIIVSYAALKHLTKDYQRKMEFLYSGEIKDGILLGNLYIKGNHAIIFSSRFKGDDFEKKEKILENQVSLFIKLLNQKGISSIKGKIIILNENEINKNYHSCSSFTFNENTIELKVDSSKSKIVPVLQQGFKLQQKNTLSDSQEFKEDVISYNKNYNSNDYWRISKKVPNLYAKDTFLKYLQKQNFVIENKDYPKENLQHLFFMKGERIETLLDAILCYSDNFRAETLSLYLKNDMPSLKNISKVLAQEGLKVKLSDGSGLSRKNKLSVSMMNKLLLSLRKEEFFPLFKKNLAVSGIKGTLKRYPFGSLKGKIYAKTGTLKGVKNLSGYVEINSKLYQFSLLSNSDKSREDFWNIAPKILLLIKNNLK